MQAKGVLEFASGGVCPEAHGADYAIVRLREQGIAGYADAVTGRSLAGEGDVGICDHNRALKVDEPANPEDDGSGPGCAARRPEGAGTAVGKGSHIENTSAATSNGLGAATRRARKRALCGR